MPERTEHWTLDRRVPVALILGMLAQVAGVVWWGAAINERVDRHEIQIAAMSSQREADAEKFERRMTLTEDRVAAAATAAARIEERLANLSASLAELKALLRETLDARGMK